MLKLLFLTLVAWSLVSLFLFGSVGVLRYRRERERAQFSTD